MNSIKDGSGFNRLDDPRHPRQDATPDLDQPIAAPDPAPATSTPDRFQQFKASTAAYIEYREAYHATARRDAKAVEGLPHPDNDGGFDPVDALARLRDRGAGNPGRLVADPAIDIRG